MFDVVRLVVVVVGLVGVVDEDGTQKLIDGDVDVVGDVVDVGGCQTEGPVEDVVVGFVVVQVDVELVVVGVVVVFKTVVG